MRMTQYVYVALLAAGLLAPSPGAGQTSGTTWTLTDVTVGQYLQTEAFLKMDGPLLPGLEITVTSNDPARAVLSLDPAEAGKASISIKLSSTSDLKFYVQALDKSGSVSYTATARGMANATGKATLAPSGFVMSGPFGVGKPMFHTSPRGTLPQNINVHPALLDGGLKFVHIQDLAGGRTAKVTFASSQPSIGTTIEKELTIPGGSRIQTTLFRPAAPGQTTLSITGPAGFTQPANFTSVVANVLKPVLMLDEEEYIGKDLMITSKVQLIEPAPKEGVQVKLTSESPERLALSLKPTETGSGSITVTIPAGHTFANFQVQALAGSGTATYTAEAAGYAPVIGKLVLRPAGFMISGPNSIMRSGANPGFVASLASKKNTILQLYVVYLDPVTQKGTDLTVQPLRPGIHLTVPAKVGDPELGHVTKPFTVTGGESVFYSEFVSQKLGASTIAIDTPPGFTQSLGWSLKVFVTE